MSMARINRSEWAANVALSHRNPPPPAVTLRRPSRPQAKRISKGWTVALISLCAAVSGISFTPPV